MGSYGYHVVGFDGTKNAVEKAKRELAARLADKTERLTGFATRAMVAQEGDALANEARSPGATTASRRT